jgi:MYXO-CTERM domain-containing protein
VDSSTAPVEPEAGKAATFSASASSAATGATLVGWKWTQTSGPATGTFGSSSAASTTFKAPSAGSYTIRLTVTDDAGRTGTTETSIQVKAAAKSSGGGGVTDLPSLLGLLGLATLALHQRRKA